MSKALCGLCGEPMPEGEEMFNYHGYSGPCPKPPQVRAELREAPHQTPDFAKVAAQRICADLAEQGVMGLGIYPERVAQRFVAIIEQALREAPPSQKFAAAQAIVEYVRKYHNSRSDKLMELIAEYDEAGQSEPSR